MRASLARSFHMLWSAGLRPGVSRLLADAGSETGAPGCRGFKARVKNPG